MKKIKKVLEPTGDVCVKFTDEELIALNIKEGDKFSIEEKNGDIVLKKFETIELDISEWDREVLEFVIAESCEKDISVNDVISNCLENAILEQ